MNPAPFLLFLFCSAAVFAGEMEIAGVPTRLWPEGGGSDVPENKIHFVFLAEGFKTAADLTEYRNRVTHWASELMSVQPYRDCLSDIYVWRIDTRSQDSGVTTYRNSGKSSEWRSNQETETDFFRPKVMARNTPFNLYLEHTNSGYYKIGREKNLLGTWSPTDSAGRDNFDYALRSIPGLSPSTPVVPIIILNTAPLPESNPKIIHCVYYGDARDNWRAPVLLGGTYLDYLAAQHEVGHSLAKLHDEYTSQDVPHALRTLIDFVTGGTSPRQNLSYSASSVGNGGPWAGYRCAYGIKPVRLDEVDAGFLASFSYIPSHFCTMRCNRNEYCPICLRALRGAIDQSAGRPVTESGPWPMDRPHLTRAEIVRYTPAGVPVSTTPVANGASITMTVNEHFRFNLGGRDADAGRDGLPHSIKLLCVISTTVGNNLDPYLMNPGSVYMSSWLELSSGQIGEVSASQWTFGRYFLYPATGQYTAKIWAMDSGGLLSDPVEFTVAVSPN